MLLKRVILVGTLLSLSLLSACIQIDDTRSFYISPNGEVDLIISQDNVHSDESDPLERSKQEKEWFKKWKSGSTDELKKLKTTGAKHIKTYLIKETSPYATITKAHYDSIEAFGKLFDLNTNENHGTVTLTQEGVSRKLLFHINEEKASANKSTSNKENPEHYPRLKFVPIDGKIIEARGCKISDDKKSCLLNFQQIEQMRKDDGYTFWVSWEVKPQK